MKKQKTRGGRALAAILGIVLVLALLWGVSAVTGNPLVAAAGQSRAARYAADVYGIEGAAVSAGQKEGAGGFTYLYTVESKTSPDTHFRVRVPLFGGITDDYDWCVRRLHNTKTRLGGEMAEIALLALGGTPYSGMVQECAVEYGYVPSTAPDTNTFPDIPYKDTFALDMPFVPNAVAVPTLLNLKLAGGDASEEELNRILPEIKAAMEQRGLRFDFYSVRYEKPDAIYDASGFTGVYWVEAVPSDTI